MPTPKGRALVYMISAIYQRDSTKLPSPFYPERQSKKMPEKGTSPDHAVAMILAFQPPEQKAINCCL